ncbi:hypothetical protein LP421_30730 (plasmid) [Rhizobium sp. RCAM05350]|nr:hypothetical protein LP421_30730 [Rhizobium sp. RCAM05350]
MDYVANIPEIQKGLVTADYLARAIRDPVTNDIVDFTDINGARISQYHDLVFASVYGATACTADASASNCTNFFDWTQDMRTGFVLDKRDWSWAQGDGVNAQVLAAQFGVGAEVTIGNLEKAALEGSAIGNGFYSNAGEDLFYSIIA